MNSEEEGYEIERYQEKEDASENHKRKALVFEKDTRTLIKTEFKIKSSFDKLKETVATDFQEK